MDLAARADFLLRTQAALAGCQTSAMEDCLLVEIRLLDFEQLILSLGYRAIDELLADISEKLKKHISPGDVVAYWHGGRFSALHSFRDKAEAVCAREIVKFVLEGLMQPFEVETMKLPVRACASYVLWSQTKPSSVDEFFQQLLAATRGLPALEHGEVYPFSEAEISKKQPPALLASELRNALASGNQLQLFYQPIFSIRTGHLLGFESLSRWKHPTLGFIPPSEFIPVAESSGLMDEVAIFCFRTAINQCRQWKEELGKEPSLSINLSGKQLASQKLAKIFFQLLRENTLNGKQFRVEVTESSLVKNIEGARKMVEQAMEHGCQISIDDFGTGYSSLSLLRNIPFNVLKIDKSFVSQMTHDDKSVAIVRMIVDLVKAFHRSCIAEGVETQEQAELLGAIGVDYAQGYYYGGPVPAEEATHILKQSELCT
jgi:EAL domain-containing protein (putative c-di-GMP-specific phosphodiesterase class I)/GGDEF domain-containing protein